METDNNIHMEGQQDNQRQEQTQNKPLGARDNDTWKKVSFGTATGILIGGGAIYAVDHIGGESATDEAPEPQNVPSSNGGPQPPIYNHAPVAHVSDSMSFSQAFAAARSQVGAGGVFSWHGGIYGTYYETEWDAMSPAQRAAYAHSVNPEVRAHHVDTTHVNEHHPDVAVRTQTETTRGQQGGSDSGKEGQSQDTTRSGNGGQGQPEQTRRTEAGTEDPTHPGKTNGGQQQGHFLEDEDVKVIARTEVQGHEAAAVDVTGNNQPDAIIIDVDDSHTLTKPDVVILRDGSQITVGEMQAAHHDGGSGAGMGPDTPQMAETADNTPEPPMEPVATQTGTEENPEVAPDMPDYMDDANIMA